MHVKTAPDGSLLLSVAEAAVDCRISRAKFYTDVLPHLRTVRLGGRHLVPRLELERFIADRQDGAK